MKHGSQTVGIVGDSGAMGKWLRAFFEGLGFRVIGSSLFSSALSNRQLVKLSDVVIFSVTLSEMVPVIQSLVPYSRPEQLWMDVGSRKKNIMDAMLESSAEVVGLHPLCAPPQGVALEGETVVRCCQARLNRWIGWVDWILLQMKARVVSCDPSFHDEMMLLTQNLPQASTIALAMALAGSGRTPGEMLKFSTTASRASLILIAKMLANTPEVYADIQVGNPDGIAALDELIRSLVLVRRLASQRKSDEIVTILKDLRAYFGEDFIAAGKKGFVR